jgi:hypothetical protein
VFCWLCSVRARDIGKYCLQLCSKNDYPVNIPHYSFSDLILLDRIYIISSCAPVPVSHLVSTSPPKRDSVALNLRLLLNADIYRTASPCQSSTKRLINGNTQQTIYYYLPYDQLFPFSSVFLSTCLSVCPSVRPSVCHLSGRISETHGRLLL